MIYTVVVSEQAAQDVEDAADWWARERSLEQAERWYAGIRQAFTTLSQQPQRCARAAEHAEYPYELRELHYGLGSRPTHRVLFTILKESVMILAVRHIAQDKLQAEDI